MDEPGLDEEDVSPAASLVTTGTLVVAMLLGTLVPTANYYALFLLFLTEPVTGRLRRRSRATAG